MSASSATKSTAKAAVNPSAKQTSLDRESKESPPQDGLEEKGSAKVTDSTSEKCNQPEKIVKSQASDTMKDTQITASNKISDVDSSKGTETADQNEEAVEKKTEEVKTNAEAAQDNDPGKSQEKAEEGDGGAVSSLGNKSEKEQAEEVAQSEEDDKEKETVEETNEDDSEEYESAETTEEDASKSESSEVPALKEEGRQLWSWLL